MKGFDVLHVKSGIKARNKFDLSRSHLTTMDFGQIVPMFVEETVPGDKFTVNAEYFSRLAPLVKPTYGKFSFKTVSAFVPYHQIAVDSDAWLAGKNSWEGDTPHQRIIEVRDLARFIYTYCCTSNGATAQNADYVIVSASGTTNYYIFTNKGRYWVKILNALGYACPQGVDNQTNSVWFNNVAHVALSAYPLLAFFKLYNDYMSQSQRFNTSVLSSMLKNIKYGVSTTGYTPAYGQLDYTTLNALFSALFLNYENDYFTSAWQKPNNALNNVENISSLTPPQARITNTVVQNSVLDTELYTPGTTQYLGQRTLDFLKDFDDWVRRNNYSGSRAVQQIYSRFGIKTDDYRSHYANVISTDEMPVQVGDVTATADSSNVILGDYAGKGIMSGGKGFTIEVSDYGLLLILGYFTVTPMNGFGFDRRVLRNTPLDYYNPEFDGLGADAISVGEYFENPLQTPSDDSTISTYTFGFTERYNAYRYGRDVITGEFRAYRPNADMSCWHTGRNMTAIRAASNLYAQSTAVNTLPQSDSEYNRIFSVSSGDVDHFYMTAKFNVSAIRPMLNLNQVVRLGEGDTAVPRNGNVIS